MSCPLNSKRWAGSGYKKTDTDSKTAQGKELDERIQKMLDERIAQDLLMFPLNATEKPIVRGEQSQKK